MSLRKRILLAITSFLLVVQCRSEGQYKLLRAKSTDEAVHPTHRSLAGVGSVTLLEAGKGVQTVKLRQTFFGTLGICEEEPENQAWIFFATFLNPDTLELDCFERRNVGGCFTKTLAIGCDPATNKAQISLYIRDELYSGHLTTDNPKIKRCHAGPADTIPRAIKIVETFDCISS